MAESNSSSPGFFGIFIALLAVLFIGLKLGNIITWSWWWVLAPLWGSFAFSFIFVMILIAIILIAGKK